MNFLRGTARRRLEKWMALSLLAGLAAALLWGAWALERQRALSQEVIRLHVIAASDSAADQALKLDVRDEVLRTAEPLVADANSRDEAARALRAALPKLEAAAARVLEEQGGDEAVSATLSVETYPTRDYGTFALPGGEYLSLRVILGAGEGHNWWCVVYPPLCTAAAEELEDTALSAGLSEDDLALITRSGEDYVLRFKSIELWQRWTAGWRK